MAISVIIATRDRTEFLRFVLAKIAPRFRKQDELVLVDDASVVPLKAGDIQSWVGTDVALRVLRNDNMFGCLRARNRGLQVAGCEFVLQLDDDSWPVGESVFEKIEEVMAAWPCAGALAFPVHEHWAQGQNELGRPYRRHKLPDGIRDFSFTGCAAALRRVAVLAAGGYPEYGYYGAEEEALGLRMLRIGYEIRVCHAVRVIHGHEVLSSSSAYIRTRVSEVQIELGSNRLCSYRESLPPMVRHVMVGAEMLKLLVGGQRGLIGPIMKAVRAKRPLVIPGLRLGYRQVLQWLLIRAGVWFRLRMNQTR